jgi:hypothetical protein
MEPNEVISKWRGDMQGDMECILPVTKDCPNVPSKETCPNECDWHVIPHPNYESDPAAWTPELFDRIEGAGLMAPFMFELNGSFPDIPKGISIIGWQFLALKSTPAQKAEALSRAIQEVEG